MDLNLEYADHQDAVMRADCAASDNERIAQLTRASSIAGRISAFQHELGAAASCAWSVAQVSALGRV
jgi:hypothetical protein